MTADQFEQQSAFENGLEPRQVVEARWTNSGRYLRARAEVVRVNRSSVRVRLFEQVESGGLNWRAGQEFPVPRLMADKWSATNGAFPLPEAGSTPPQSLEAWA